MALSVPPIRCPHRHRHNIFVFYFGFWRESSRASFRWRHGHRQCATDVLRRGREAHVSAVFRRCRNYHVDDLQPNRLRRMPNGFDRPVTHAELDEFIAVYRARRAEALGPTPRLARRPMVLVCPADLPVHRTCSTRGYAPCRRPGRPTTSRRSRPGWSSSTRSRTSARRCAIRPASAGERWRRPRLCALRRPRRAQLA